MQPTNNIGYLLQHLASVLAKQSDQNLQDRLGIGFSQFKILMVLQWHPNVQQRQIAEALGQTEASISRQIKLMHDKGWLQSTTSPANRRERITTPTTKGVHMTEEARAVLNEYHSPMFGRLSETQIARMLEGLVIMHDYVCQPGKTGACDHPLNV
jgi:DNA-binding MarR family transcriptional regulator